MFDFLKLVDHIRSVFPKHDSSFSRFLDVTSFTINTDGTGSAVLTGATRAEHEGLHNFREQRHYYENSVAAMEYLGNVNYVEYRHGHPISVAMQTIRLTLNKDHDYTQGIEPSEPFKLAGYVGTYANIINNRHTIVKVLDKRTIDIVPYGDVSYTPLPLGSLDPSGCYNLAYLEILKDTTTGKINVVSKSFNPTNGTLTLSLNGFAPRSQPLVLKNTKYELGSDIYLMPTNQDWVNAIVSKEFSRKLMFVVPLEASGVQEQTLAPEMSNMGATFMGQYGRYRVKHTFSILVLMPAKDTKFHTQNLHYCYHNLAKAIYKTLVGYGQTTDDYSTVAAVTLVRHGMADNDMYAYHHEYVFTVTTELAGNINTSDTVTSSYIESGVSLREFSGDLIINETEQDLGDFTVNFDLPEP